jgi:hypothetical protein
MLKVALQRFELTPNASGDPGTIAKPKNVLVNDIADLEL